MYFLNFPSNSNSLGKSSKFGLANYAVSKNLAYIHRITFYKTETSDKPKRVGNITNRFTYIYHLTEAKMIQHEVSLCF